jgi:hypothetical protein
MNLAPIVFIGFIIFFMAMSARVRKQAEEARRANQQRAEAQRQNAASSAVTSVQTPAAVSRNQTAASPRVQPQTTASAKTTAPSARQAVQKQQELKPTAETRPSVKTDAATSLDRAGNMKTQNKQTLEEVKNPVVQWNRDSALQGIILAEILGKPKALRHK